MVQTCKARVWLVPEGALDLAMLRVAVAAIVLSSPESWRAARAAALPAQLRVAPEGLGWALTRVPIEPSLARAAQWVLVAAAVATLVGACSRAASGLLTLSGLYVFGLSQLTGSVTHDMHLLWFSALLAVSPCGDALSIDRVLARRRAGARARAERPAPSLAYAVPLQAARMLLGVVYFFPGFWKLATSGSAWIWSDNLRNQMHWKWYQMATPLPAVRIDRMPELLHLGALSVVTFELTFVALALWPRTRLLAAVAGLTFHALTEMLMGIPFLSLWGCYVVLVDWTRLFTRSDGSLQLRVVDSGLRGARPALIVGALLLTANVVQGARGAMQAWPFACYPTFQWTVGAEIPDLRIEAVRDDGSVRVVPDGPSTFGTRSQQDWGTAWRVAGVYGEPVSTARLSGYWEQLRRQPEAAAAARGARELRFYRAYYAVAPERRGEPPTHELLLGRMRLEPASP